MMPRYSSTTSNFKIKWSSLVWILVEVSSSKETSVNLSNEYCILGAIVNVVWAVAFIDERHPVFRVISKPVSWVHFSKLRESEGIMRVTLAVGGFCLYTMAMSASSSSVNEISQGAKSSFIIKMSGSGASIAIFNESP